MSYAHYSVGLSNASGPRLMVVAVAVPVKNATSICGFPFEAQWAA